MIMDEMTQKVLSKLEEKGWRGRIVSIEHLPELQQEIEKRHHQGLFDEEFFQEHLTYFFFRPPDELKDAKSIIVVAVPQPQIEVVFHWKKEAHPLVIPPTYLHYPNDLAEELLQSLLNPKGYHLARSGLPLKLLAVRSGLGFYGKNNICYVPGIGSFHRLMAFYSDLPCTDDDWHQAQMMENCQNCSACLRSCPTGAIVSESFLLRAERCLTFHNERAADFPQWIIPSWHNCLVGCLCCQKVCPQNKDIWGWVERKAEFSEEETFLLLTGAGKEKFPAVTLKKLEDFDLIEYLEVLPRNLSMLLNQGQEQKT